MGDASEQDLETVEKSYLTFGRLPFRTADYILRRVINHPDTDAILTEAHKDFLIEISHSLMGELS